MTLPTEKVLEMAQLRAQGVNKLEVHNKTGIARSTVHEYSNKSEFKELVEACRKDIMEKGLAKATENVVWAIDNMQKTKDSDIFQAGKEFSKSLMQSIGAFPSPAPSVMINNIINNNQILSPAVAGILQKFVDSFTAPQQFEGEVVEEAIE